MNAEGSTNKTKDIIIELPPLGFFPWETPTLVPNGIHCDRKEDETDTTLQPTIETQDTVQSADVCNVLAQNITQSLKNTRSVSLSKLLAHPFIVEYLTELDWVTRNSYFLNIKSHYTTDTRTSKLSCASNALNMGEEECITRTCYQKIRPFYSSISVLRPEIFSRPIQEEGSKKKPQMNTVVLLPKSSSNDKRSKKLSFKAYPTQYLRKSIAANQIEKSQLGVLASCYPNQSCYAVTNTQNEWNTGVTSAGLKVSENVNISNNNKNDENITNTTQAGKNYYSLLVKPVEPSTLYGFMESVGIPAAHRGLASPVSPFLLESQQQSTPCSGQQPKHNLQNILLQCSLHQHPKKKQRIQEDGWFWDKSQPLGCPALCSCANESLFKLWTYELSVHEKVCNTRINSLSNDVKEFSGLDAIDWSAVFERQDFTSFLSDMSIEKLHLNSKEDTQLFNNFPSYTDLRFCPMCGGLPYIPFSFIEFSLNKAIPTLQDLALRLPLPIPTELFCDGGLRVTACLVTRSRLHEWIALKALSYIDLCTTVRVYQVCSASIVPFHRLQEFKHDTAHSNLVSSTSSVQNPNVLPKALPSCSRHNLHYDIAFDKYTKISPSRFVLMQQRRPYCLLPRPGINDRDLSSHEFDTSLQERLKIACFTWLKLQRQRAS
jgi:hypothetical protein